MREESRFSHRSPLIAHRFLSAMLGPTPSWREAQTGTNSMVSPDLVMYEEEYQQIKEILARLQGDSNSKICFLVDKNGQQIAAHGDMKGVDATSLASLTAGNVAATDGLAKLIGEKE